MRRPRWTPSIVSNGNDQNVYIVVDDFGHNGRAFRETDVEAAGLETTITKLLDGEYSNPARVVAFNTAMVSGRLSDIAQEIRRRCDLQASDVSSAVQDFVEQNEDYDRQQLTLRLV